ncbi:hypothetical protein GF336_03015 [Candidatus Woesearchaeota archaeon]|nr:hypothetical protein [Candidatus Woesearchaeota archaeon]
MSLETNLIYCGDCKEVLKRDIPDESIDLIYLDPPFFSNKKYEIIWGNGAELRSFEDRWKGGINHYIGWMEEKLELCRDSLKETGSICVHADHRASHYLKVSLDRIFGYNKFENEIIWHFTGGGRSKKHLPRKHHNILRYRKGDSCVFNSDEVREPYSETSGYAKDGITSKAGKKYKPNPKGKIMDDVWDIPIINPLSKERIGYPTQKPIPLLDRIIRAFSNEEDVILDPVSGGGTTVEAAYNANRRWIGIDVSPVACKVIKERLESLEGIVEVNIKGGPVTMDDLKRYSDQEFQEWACERVGGRSKKKKRSDKGIDGYTLGNIPISVKQSKKAGRNVIDNFETAIRRDKKNKGIVIAYSFTKGSYEEVARVKDLDIKLIEAKKISHHMIDGDELF